MAETERHKWRKDEESGSSGNTRGQGKGDKKNRTSCLSLFGHLRGMPCPLLERGLAWSDWSALNLTIIKGQRKMQKQLVESD